MEQHVRVISVLLILYGVIGLVLAICIGIFGTGAIVAMLSADTSEEMRIVWTIIGFVATAAAVIMAIVALPNIIAGWGLSQRKRWSRVLTIILAVLALPNIPIGTALGVYAIVVMLDQDTKRLLTQ